MNQPAIQHSTFNIQYAVGLFLVLAAFFALTMGGHTYSRDEETMFYTTEALARSAQFTLPPGLPVADTIKLSDGSEVSKYGPLKSVLQLPLYWLGNVVAGGYPDEQHGFITRLYVGIFNPLVHAAIAALLFLFAIGLGYRRRAGYLVAFLYAFATFAWPHTRTQFAEPLSALLMFAALYFAWRGGGVSMHQGSGQQGGINHAPTKSDNARDVAVGAAGGINHAPTEGDNAPEVEIRVADGINPAPTNRETAPQPLIPPSSLLIPNLFSGLLMAAAMATKFQNLIVFPIILAYAAWLAWKGRGASRWWLAVGGWLAGFMVGYLPLGLYNLYFFGSFFSSGYGDASGISDIVFATPMNQGLYDLLLSPGKGLLWFAPPVMLLPFAIPFAWRRNAALTLACVATLLVHVLFYSMNRFWHGDGSWGPRYLMPALPFALLPVAALIERLWPAPAEGAANRSTRLSPLLLGRTAVILLAAFGISGQLFGSAVNFDSYINQTYADHGGDTAAGDQYRYFTVEGSPLLGQVRMLADRWREWQPNLNPPPNAITLASGFSISEGKGGAPLPRWTTGAGIIKLSAPTGVLSLTLTLADHRPPPLPRASVQVISDYGSSAAHVISGTALSDGVSKQYQLQFAASQQSHTLAILSDTWNPWTAGIPRNEVIGIDLTSLQPSVKLPIVGATITSMPQHSAKQRFDWFYRPDYHHLIDHWRWYVAYSGLSPSQQDGLANSVYISGGVMLLLGLICFLPLRRSGRAQPAPAAT